MKYLPCSKCGALHTKTSKHKPVIAQGVTWCGKCGTRLNLTVKLVS